MLDRIASLLKELGGELLNFRNRSNASSPAEIGAKADQFAHRFLSKALTSFTPDIPVVSEEDRSSHTHDRPGRYWLIDPIDGTASYVGGYDGYVTQLALMESDRPVIGGVFSPVRDELFLAEQGAGATLNGARLAINPRPHQRRLIDNYPEPRGTAARVYETLTCTGYVESGSLGLKICRIADGTAEIFFKDVIVRDWDIAPAEIILTEAGGNLVLPNGQPFIFRGDFVKPGVIAAVNRDLVLATVECLGTVSA